ncbi:MAG: hypothetical protein IJW64_07070 [Clostridia bacterium]|nr:hypothetical protein [Clostridia bacterium]
MNNDYLRVNSKIDEQEIATSEFNNKKKVNTDDVPKKLTLASLLNFSRSKQIKDEMKAENMPNIRNILFIFFIQVFVVIVLILISLLTNDVTVLMFNVAIASMVFPVIMVLFFYNFNKSKNTSIIEVILGIALGLGSYVALEFLQIFFNSLFSYSWFSEILDVVIRDVCLFIIANVFIKIAKKDSLFDAMLLTVSIYAGYIFANSLDVLINSLFINVEVSNGQNVISTGAIILGEESFKYVIKAFVKTVCFDVLYMSAVMSSYAVVNGGVIGLNVSPLKDKGYREWSLYLLFLITVVLHLGATFPSTLWVFNLILKVISIVFSLILSITILNYYLSKIHLSKNA